MKKLTFIITFILFFTLILASSVGCFIDITDEVEVELREWEVWLLYPYPAWFLAHYIQDI